MYSMKTLTNWSSNKIKRKERCIMKQYLKVDEEVIKALKAAGRADLLESQRSMERADFLAKVSNANLRELAIRFPHVVISGEMVYCFSDRAGKEFKWYFRSIK